jgi:hypothetical protein
MYRPKKQIRLNSLPHAPKVADVKHAFNEAKQAKGCTVELPWANKSNGQLYSLTVRVEMGGGDPMWTLYEGEGPKSRVVWSSPFEDVDLLYDVLMLSIPEELNIGLSSAPEFSGSAGSRASRDSKPVEGVPLPPGFYGDGLLTGNEKLEVPQSYGSSGGASASSDADLARLAKSADVSSFEQQWREDFKANDDSVVQQSGVQQQQSYPQQMPPQQPYPPQGQVPPGQVPPVPVPPGYGYHPGYPYPVGYPGPLYYPSPYPQGYPPGYPPGYQDPTQLAAAQAAQQAAQQQAAQQAAQKAAEQAAQQSKAEAAARAQEQERLKNRPNMKLGVFLVEAGLVPESTVDAALQLQELVRSGKLSTAQAGEAVRRAHVRGGGVDPKLIAAPVVEAYRGEAPPLGQILVEAAIIRGPIIREALKLQENIRNATMTREQAIDALCLEAFGVARKSGDKGGETSESTRALELLRKAQLVGDLDHETASKVRDKHGGQLVSILVKAGKLDQHTNDAAIKCNSLIDQGKIEEGKAIVALHYCQRSRISLDEALKELGWEIDAQGQSAEEHAETATEAQGEPNE